MGVKFKSSPRIFHNKIKSVTFYIYFFEEVAIAQRRKYFEKTFKSLKMWKIFCFPGLLTSQTKYWENMKKRYLIDACSRFYWFQVIVMVVVFCFCWAPYASFAMINILGHGKVGNNDELQARAKASLNILTFCAKT